MENTLSVDQMGESSVDVNLKTIERLSRPISLLEIFFGYNS
jgi:hypothetical protein